MRIVGTVLATVAICGAFAAFAQSSSGPRAALKLKGPYEMNCNPVGERCFVPVYAFSTSDGNCWVRIDYGLIRVPPTQAPGGRPIRVVWFVFNDDLKDDNNYYFKSNGVDIKLNNVKLDFDTPGNDAGERRRFKWHSVHKQTGVQLDYDLIVQRISSTGASKDCRPTDPKIVNIP